MKEFKVNNTSYGVFLLVLLIRFIIFFLVFEAYGISVTNWVVGWSTLRCTKKVLFLAKKNKSTIKASQHALVFCLPTQVFTAHSKSHFFVLCVSRLPDLLFHSVCLRLFLWSGYFYTVLLFVYVYILTCLVLLLCSKSWPTISNLIFRIGLCWID